jgi:hypothetical protein
MEDLKRELLANVENWVSNNFNYQSLHVYDTMADSNLFEFIRQSDISAEDFINDFDLWDEYADYLAENEIEDNDEEEHNQNKRDFAENHEHYQEFEDRFRDDNYPMWNTLFEFRNEHGEEVTEKCVEAGFGVIEGMEDFNTTLFVSGAGYSFYAQHWIPLWLSLPYTDNEKYKNIDFSDL